ncbi:MAG: lyase family protein, partial [Atribacterota bacterium]|nr:lyase family protein [Atribacterota bacterium]
MTGGMIERYSLPKMKAIWSDEHRFEIWLKIELLALEAWSQLGLLLPEEVELIRRKVTFSKERMLEIEQVTRHDVIAFLTTLSEGLGEEGRFLHFGLTSSDVLDTATACLLKESAEVILADIDEVCSILREKAVSYTHL